MSAETLWSLRSGQLEGVFVRFSSFGEKNVPFTSTIYRESSHKHNGEETSKMLHPATWIFDRRGGKCGILLDYEQESSKYFNNDQCQFILLSRSNSIPKWRYDIHFIKHAPGDQFMVYQQLVPYQ